MSFSTRYAGVYQFRSLRIKFDGYREIRKATFERKHTKVSLTRYKRLRPCNGQFKLCLAKTCFMGKMLYEIANLLKTETNVVAVSELLKKMR